MTLTPNLITYAFLASVSFSTIAEAADSAPTKTDSQKPQESSSDWKVSLGAFGFVKPEYEGSNDYDVTGFPFLDIRWRNRVFLNTRDGLGVNIWRDRMFTLSTSIGYTFGRNEDASNDLNGLGDIDGGALAIVKGEMRYEGFAFSTRFSHQLTGEDTGYQVDFGLGYSFRSPSGWFLRPGLNASYASGQYMDEFFSVSAGQSVASGLAVKDADAGFKSYGARVLAGYRFNRNWRAISRFSYDRLVGDAADSPITKDRDQFAIGLGLVRRF